MVGIFRFNLARLFRSERKIAAMSCSRDELLGILQGKTVALVGNSRALAQTEFGEQIDHADVVIRINGAPMPSPKSHGSRTTWLALAISIDRPTEARIAADRILWMSHKRKRLPYRIATRSGFFLFNLANWAALKTNLGAPPSTGIMAISLLADSQASRIDLFGFDFFDTKSLSGRREAAQVPHDFAAEKDFVEALVTSDQRFHIN